VQKSIRIYKFKEVQLSLIKLKHPTIIKSTTHSPSSNTTKLV